MHRTCTRPYYLNCMLLHFSPVRGGGGGGGAVCVCVRACVRACVCVCARASLSV